MLQTVKKEHKECHNGSTVRFEKSDASRKLFAGYASLFSVNLEAMSNSTPL